jgi:hypothetical protein
MHFNLDRELTWMPAFTGMTNPRFYCGIPEKM